MGLNISLVTTNLVFTLYLIEDNWNTFFHKNLLPSALHICFIHPLTQF
jgi:hypothetical protein